MRLRTNESSLFSEFRNFRCEPCRAKQFNCLKCVGVVGYQTRQLDATDQESNIRIEIHKSNWGSVG